MIRSRFSISSTFIGEAICRDDNVKNLHSMKTSIGSACRTTARRTIQFTFIAEADPLLRDQVSC